MKHKELLLVSIFLLGIGFATVATTLYLNGDVKIATNNADFDVKFTKTVLDGTDISSDAISSDGKTISFGTKDLSTVGDISKLDFEVTNNSEMYDADVSIDCTTNGDKSSYYEITKEVASPIAGKRTEAGKIEVKLLKASVEDFSETFTCTLNATARERTSKAKEKYTPKYFAVGDSTTSSPQDYTTLTYPEGASAAGQPARVFIGSDGTQKSICMVKNGRTECFRGGSTTAYVSEEQEHLKEVFGETNCSVSHSGSGLSCVANNFTCLVLSYGPVQCTDEAAKFYCSLNPGGGGVCNYSSDA